MGVLSSAQAVYASTFVSTLSVGPVWENAGQTQNLTLSPDIVKTYTANQNTSVLADAELFLGLQRDFELYHIQSQFGLLATTASTASFSGDIWDNAEPIFNNYVYNYALQHTSIGIQGKLIKESSWFAIKPYLTGSIGASFNYAHGYTSFSRDYQAVVAPNFSSKMVTAFTYSLGAGVQRALNKHVEIGVGYAFSDWGKSQLGYMPGQTLNHGITMDHVYTNGLLVNFTYLA
jgi:hypothetical protein